MKERHREILVMCYIENLQTSVLVRRYLHNEDSRIWNDYMYRQASVKTQYLLI